MGKRYQMCTRCVMDTTDRDIEFDEKGVCNHCRKYDEIVKNKRIITPDRQIELEKKINEIIKAGRNKKYDCIMGVSGGVDSSYVAYLAYQYKLRPLAVHLDNGWDSKEAQENIRNIIGKLGFDLFTYEADWEEFKDLQRAYLKSSVGDIEVLTDNAMISFIHNIALKKNIKYQLWGMNVVTESIMPKSWYYNKKDTRNISAIQKKFGSKKIKNIIFISTFQYLWNTTITKKVEEINLLDYIDYNKLKVRDILEKEFSWKDYGKKHYESIFTRFFQGYILPKKFGIDKRRPHLSNLICSGQITRKEAIDELKKDPYSSKILLEEDKDFVLSRLGFSKDEFEKIMSEKPKSHLDYPNETAIMRYIYAVGRLIKPFIKYQ